MEKIKTGIYGLNPLLEGGFNKNTVSIIVGATGTGKTTFATQFLHRGLEEGEEAIYITLEERKEQILKEAAEMGWGDLQDYVKEDQLVFIEAGGFEFSEFIKEELPEFVSEWAGSRHARIAIDPLTPIIWTAKDNYKQRELISTLFHEAKKVGTVLATLEEHGTFGNLSGPETVIPMYLSDTVIHMKYITRFSSLSHEHHKELEVTKVDTALRIVKSRSSWHSTVSHPYMILNGIGLIIEGVDIGLETHKFPSDLSKNLEAKFEKLPKIEREKMEDILKSLSSQDIGKMNPHQLISLILNEYGISLS
jgi:KaiC/GvpD/RAD55 family RecA-like ATPase